jgi:hypothetical protein
MTEKFKIVGALGEESLLLPALVNNALTANDPAKYFFALSRQSGPAPTNQIDHFPVSARNDLPRPLSIRNSINWSATRGAVLKVAT